MSFFDAFLVQDELQHWLVLCAGGVPLPFASVVTVGLVWSCRYVSSY